MSTKKKREKPRARLYEQRQHPPGAADDANLRALFARLAAPKDGFLQNLNIIERLARHVSQDQRYPEGSAEGDLARELLIELTIIRGTSNNLPQDRNVWAALNTSMLLGAGFERLRASLVFGEPVAAARTSELRGQQNRTTANSRRQQEADDALLKRFRTWQDKQRLQLKRLGAEPAAERVKRFKLAKRPLPDRDSRRLTRLLNAGKIPPL